MLGRRSFLSGAVGTALSGAIVGLAALLPGSRVRAGLRLRPPGALPEKDFLAACTRCFKCGNACPNGCIGFHPLEDGLESGLTPYISARERGCILCGKCAEVCPTGALRPFGTTQEDWIANVDMGTARVNESMCFSFNGRTCGACYQACPLAGSAIQIGVFETPHVKPDACVGCGLCEQACLHLPQAIRVIPRALA